MMICVRLAVGWAFSSFLVRPLLFPNAFLILGFLLFQKDKRIGGSADGRIPFGRSFREDHGHVEVVMPRGDVWYNRLVDRRRP